MERVPARNHVYVTQPVRYPKLWISHPAIPVWESIDMKISGHELLRLRCRNVPCDLIVHCRTDGSNDARPSGGVGGVRVGSGADLPGRRLYHT